MKSVSLFTDGACSGNPGPGGWGVLLRYNGNEKELSGGEKETTNNRMELTAAVKGLNALKESCRVDLYTDSEYLKNGVTQWMPQWKKNGWRTSSKKDVRNKDLWLEIDALMGRHDVHFHWVRGHSGHEENERVDRLARNAIPSGDAVSRSELKI